MATKTDAIEFSGGGSFLSASVTAHRVFTREDLSPAQQMFGRVAEDFMSTEVIPREQEIYDKDWALTRELLLKAGELDLLRVDIPEAYGGLGLDKVSSASWAKRSESCPRSLAHSGRTPPSARCR